MGMLEPLHMPYRSYLSIAFIKHATDLSFSRPAST